MFIWVKQRDPAVSVYIAIARNMNESVIGTKDDALIKNPIFDRLELKQPRRFVPSIILCGLPSESCLGEGFCLRASKDERPGFFTRRNLNQEFSNVQDNVVVKVERAIQELTDIRTSSNLVPTERQVFLIFHKIELGIRIDKRISKVLVSASCCHLLH